MSDCQDVKTARNTTTATTKQQRLELVDADALVAVLSDGEQTNAHAHLETKTTTPPTTKSIVSSALPLASSDDISLVQIRPTKPAPVNEKQRAGQQQTRQQAALLSTFKGKQEQKCEDGVAQDTHSEHEQTTRVAGAKHQFGVVSNMAHKLGTNLKLIDRNSLESIESKFSTSSATDETRQPTPELPKSPSGTPSMPKSSPSPSSCSSSSSGSSSSSVVIETRYVSPPKLNDRWLASLDHTIPEMLAAADQMTPLEARSKQLSAVMQLGHERQSGQASHFDKSQPKSTSNNHSTATNQHRPRDDDPSAAYKQPGKSVESSTSPPSSSMGKVKPPFMFAGILASLTGSVFFAISVLCIKLLPDSEGFEEKVKALFFRGTFLTVLCGTAIIWQNGTVKIRRDEIWVNILRALFGFMGVLGAYISLKYISMGDSTALVFSSPVWTSILSRIILKEPLRWTQIAALPASIFGIILIAHPALIVDVEQFGGPPDIEPPLPPTNHSTMDNLDLASTGTPSTTIHEAFDFERRWPGIAIALTTSFFVSCVYIVLKFRKSTPIQTTTFWLGITTIVATLLIMCGIGFGRIPDTGREWFLLFLNGFSSWCGQSVLQWAFTYEDASVLSIIRTMDVAMSFALSAMFLNEEIYWTSIVGAFIVSTVVAWIMLNNWIQNVNCSKSSTKDTNGRLSSVVTSKSDSITSSTVNVSVHDTKSPLATGSYKQRKTSEAA